MEPLILFNRYLHITMGFVGLAAWWIPIFASKGKTVHVRLGRVFMVCAYVVAISAIVSPPLRIGGALLEGISWAQILPESAFLVFLGYLGIVTLNAVHFGVQVIRTRAEPRRLDTPFMRIITWAMPLGSLAAIAFALLFWSPISIILLLFSPLGIFGARDQLRYLDHPPGEKMAWFFAHMESMLGAGIAFHTAFLVFGSRQLFDLSLLGPFNWVPWILPSIIGITGGELWKRHYQRKFGILDAQPSPARP